MANLTQVRHARKTAAQYGWKIRSVGDGNQHHLHFTSPSGRKFRIWYPWEGRVHNLEEQDLEEAIRAMSSGENNPNHSSNLSLAQRKLVSAQIAKEYRKWRRAKGEPTEAQRRQITRIGFEIARRKDPKIPAYQGSNPDLKHGYIVHAKYSGRDVAEFATRKEAEEYVKSISEKALRGEKLIIQQGLIPWPPRGQRNPIGPIPVKPWGGVFPELWWPNPEGRVVKAGRDGWYIRIKGLNYGPVEVGSFTEALQRGGTPFFNKWSAENALNEWRAGRLKIERENPLDLGTALISGAAAGTAAALVNRAARKNPLSKKEIGELYRIALKQCGGDAACAQRLVEAYLAGQSGMMPRKNPLTARESSDIHSIAADAVRGGHLKYARGMWAATTQITGPYAKYLERDLDELTKDAYRDNPGSMVGYEWLVALKRGSPETHPLFIALHRGGLHPRETYTVVGDSIIWVPRVELARAREIARLHVKGFQSNPLLMTVMGANPSAVDRDAERELEIFITNDADLYRQRYIPIIKNLMLKRAKGIFDPEKAVTLFMYLVDEGARKYIREFGTRGQRVGEVFNRATRLAVARTLTDDFITEADLGNYGRLIGRNPLTRSEAAEALKFSRHGVRAAREPWRYPREKSFIAGEAHGLAEAVELFGPREAGRSARQMMYRASAAQNPFTPGWQKPTVWDVKVEVWEERDRLHIALIDKRNEKIIAEWWDEDAQQMFEDGFFESGRKLESSVIKYAEDMGLLRKRLGNPLTQRESAQALRRARGVMAEAERYGQIGLRSSATFEAGRSVGMTDLVRQFGTRRASKIARRISPRATKMGFALNVGAKASRAQFVRETVAPKGQFDSRSFRVVKQDGHSIVIGCPKGSWDPVRKVCKIGTRAHAILHPMKKNGTVCCNPSKFSIGRGPTKRVLTSTQARRLMENPMGRRRKVTMPLGKFAAMLQKQGDPEMIRAFKKKIEGYRKWTHGTLPKTVTLETMDVPGVKGLWITYDAGKEPEALYVMPKGAKRGGAWRHEWGTMPALKHDPEAGIILKKLGGTNRVTDFLHGN